MKYSRTVSITGMTKTASSHVLISASADGTAFSFIVSGEDAKTMFVGQGIIASFTTLDDTKGDI